MPFVDFAPTLVFRKCFEPCFEFVVNDVKRQFKTRLHGFLFQPQPSRDLPVRHLRMRAMEQIHFNQSIREKPRIFRQMIQPWLRVQPPPLRLNVFQDLRIALRHRIQQSLNKVRRGCVGLFHSLKLFILLLASSRLICAAVCMSVAATLASVSTRALAISTLCSWAFCRCSCSNWSWRCAMR